MDAVLQRHCARYIYVVPDGLRELMSDISREVLRSDPENIYTFIADYLDALMITRENARVAARMVQSITEITENIISLLESTGIDRRDAENVANIMQHVFRKYIDVKPGPKRDLDEGEIINEILAAAHIGLDEANRAAMVIQQAFLKFKEKKDRERELLTGMIDWRVAARSTIYLYRHTGVSSEEANRAATLIKAAYKGYYTRKVMKRLAEETLHRFDQESASSSDYSSSEDLEEGEVLDQPAIYEIVTEMLEEILDRVISIVGTETDFTAQPSTVLDMNDVMPDTIEQAFLKALETTTENG